MPKMVLGKSGLLFQNVTKYQSLADIYIHIFAVTKTLFKSKSTKTGFVQFRVRTTCDVSRSNEFQTSKNETHSFTR